MRSTRLDAMVASGIARWFRTVRGSHRNRATEDELAVLGTILSGPDPRFQKLIAQLQRAPEIERVNPSPGSFRVAPTSTFDDISFPLEVQRIDSDWLALRDALSGRDLEFRVSVGRHGFLRGLEGRTRDGKQWPRSWEVDRSSLKPPHRELLRLPSLDEQRELQDTARRRLSEWLETELPREILLFRPAGEAEIAMGERRFGGRLPEAYRRFLLITDGLDLRDGFGIAGINDAYEIDNAHLPLVHVAWDADDTDEFLVALPHDGRDQAVYRIDVHDPEARPRKIAAEFRGYLASRVREG